MRGCERFNAFNDRNLLFKLMKFGKQLLLSAAFVALMTSCVGTKDVQYVQDMTPNSVEFAKVNPGLQIEPDDLLSIVVTTKNPELGTEFNMQPGMMSMKTEGSGGMSSSSTVNKRELGYRVDNEGDIVFPVLGTLHVAGLTRRELESMIKQRITKEGLLKDFSVSVSFLNSKISILGDVGSPGNYDFKEDKYTLLQALADAGDLNMTAEREIYVIREKGGERKLYAVDLRSKELFNSPVYYLQQNDIIYVLPNDQKAATRDSNSSSFRQWSTWLTLFSFAGSIATMIVALTK